MTAFVKPRLRFFEDSAGQRHILGEDRYLYAPTPATHRVNVIGAGTIGQEHMRVAALHGRFTVNGIFDERQTSVDAALQQLPADQSVNLRQYATLDEACQDDTVDALFICTPNHTHLDVLHVALKSGKPLFLEKPMATTMADAATMLTLLDNYEPFVQIGLQYRFKAPYVEACHEVLNRHTIGDVVTLSMCEYRPPFLDKVGQWNKFSRNTGGTLVEKCCHYFDLLNLFAGARPKRIYASAGQAQNFLDFEYQGERSDIDDHAFVTIDYGNGTRAQFTLNMFAPQFFEELVISGRAGRLVATERFDFHREQASTSALRIELGEDGASRDVQLSYPAQIEASGHHGATFYEHLAFADQLAGQPASSATPTEGFWSIVTACAAEQSAREGKAIDVADYLNEQGLEKFAKEIL